MSIKTEVEAAETSTAYIDIEIDLNYLQQEAGSIQSVKSEPGSLVKEESLEDSRKDANELQCIPGALTAAGTGIVNDVCSTSLGDFLHVKQELCDMDIGSTVLQRMDIHYAINKNTSAVAEDNTMVGDGNEAMPGSGVKKESLEEELRDNKTVSCKYHGQAKEDDDDEALVKSCVGQQKDLQKHLQHRSRIISLNDFKYDRTFQKPHLLSIPKKLHLQTNRKATAAISAVAGCSNQSGSQSVKIKRKTICIKEKPFVCDICKKGYSSKAGLNLHKRSHSVVEPSACHTFDAKLGVKTNLTNYQSHDEKHCDSKFEQCGDLLPKQMRNHTGEKPYQCVMCDARFARRSDLTRHMGVHTGEKPYQCEMCDARFARRSGITRHMRVHTGEKPYQCEMCDASFAERSRITLHMRVHMGERPHRCDMCEARFVQSSDLTKHMRVHTGEKPYQCEMCDARFSQSSGLALHRKIHTGDKPYRCDMCGARFARSIGLSEHKVIHTGEKPHQCDMCDARFAQSSGLTQHRRIHTGEKPYQCHMCETRFARSGDLTNHLRIHTGEKPYQCEICDARFARKGGVNVHMRVHKGDNI